MSVLAPILPWVQVILSLLIIALILIQRSEGDLGAAFGGSSSGGAAHTKRGMEKTFFVATVVLVIIFAILAVLALFVKI